MFFFISYAPCATPRYKLYYILGNLLLRLKNIYTHIIEKGVPFMEDPDGSLASSSLVNDYEYFILQDLHNQFLFFGGLFNEVQVKCNQRRHLSQAMLSLHSSFIIFAQTEQTKSMRCFSLLDLRTDNHASFSKFQHGGCPPFLHPG